ncbi:major capsid protein VP5 [Sulfolobus filamentous virus 1]|uniref:Major capsid protein VP5 n=1 Tax=Sulfolobus filamentous virus 1 TaxID=2304198 RepID=CAPS2_SUFV1|nr:major capsid protein VP5 [Sulfolobus filamentous virus 1]A0A346LU63.1 RecName: Full=Major capsid protein VP5 [Sulfolobus filamentous virus 1]6D5F_A Chain A, Fimbrial protein [Sulfolobus filamentous virus 1]6D5F_B Chain B, Fimbrial protein [Sulfolobus filamentous virus 1]6D5F_C Chain C, Fimbrial protein [Sulfolobus filamentous virus 1]6D5F_D Chain D, Fimbrial protein [Sulfolobus filamentous virus 1]6D5F_E Chain E, Fimbrial protein [Sulfolobus filamentous virus 1]6D5F_F Chain F, Fimbrial pr
MARKRTSKNDPLRMYLNYVRKLQTMGDAYDESAKYRIANFENGFKSLHMVENEFKQYLANVIDEAIKSGASPQDLPYVNEIKLALMKIFTSWLKYSNEKLGANEIAINVAGTATMTLTENLYGTRVSCEEAVSLINSIFAVWVGVEPFEAEEREGACLVTPRSPLPPVPISSPTGFSAPIQEVLQAKSPEEIIGVKGGA